MQPSKQPELPGITPAKKTARAPRATTTKEALDWLCAACGKREPIDQSTQHALGDTRPCSCGGGGYVAVLRPGKKKTKAKPTKAAPKPTAKPQTAKKPATRSPKEQAEDEPRCDQPCDLCGCAISQMVKRCNGCYGLVERVAENVVEQMVRGGQLTLSSDVDQVVEFAYRVGLAVARRRRGNGG